MPGSGAQPSEYKYCQDLNGNNDPCCPMGGLYEWANLMTGLPGCNGIDGSSSACSTPVQGLCPSGWHVPSHYEWTLMENNISSNPGIFPYDETTNNLYIGTDENLKLISTSWGGNNSSGFNALPGGASLDNHLYSGNSATFWTSTLGNGGAWNHGVNNGVNIGVLRVIYTTFYGFSVRCVHD
jgi:uncharacterized protein (TIGR02145 family)